MADNHQRHRPSTAIIRRHARLLRARYVDLLQKTLLPSFLLAGSRHALFSTLLPPLAVYYLCLSFFRRLSSLLASPIFPLLDAMRALLNAHTRTHTHPSACISRERRLNAPLSVQTRMRVRPECPRGGHPVPPPLDFLTPLSSSLPACLPPARRLSCSLWCARCVTFVCVSGIHYH